VSALKLLVVEIVRHRPGNPGAACPAEIAVHCTGTELQAPCDSTLAQTVSEPRRRSTSRIFRIDNLSPGIPIPLAKGSRLPSVEDCQRNRPTIASTIAFMITGIGVHDPPDSAFTINWIGCSRSTGFGVHNPPERASWMCACVSGTNLL
jgi:hypothetical protein